MAPPPIQVFLTTIASQVTLRQRQEYILRILQVKKIPFTSYDLASDESAKKLWKRKAPLDKQQLPGLLIGGEFPGDFSQFEEAVEFNELDQFLRRNEDYKPFEDDAPLLRAEPIGVPGAYSPLQMYPKHAPSRSPSPSPLKLKEKEKNEINAGDTLAEFGLENVSVSEDELRPLVEELGLGGDEASDLVKGLAGNTTEDKVEGEVKAAAPKVKVESEVAAPKVKVESEAKAAAPKVKEDTVETASGDKNEDVAKSKADEEPASASEPAIVKVSPPEETAT